MAMIHSLVRRRRARLAAFGLVAGGALVSSVADAHFHLLTPENWMIQAADGTPQKTGPCGNEAPQNPSNAVTSFRPGDTVTIQLEETVFHPGHYRVALAVNSPSELPAEPLVTAGATACGSVPIQSNPIFPILADGMLQHTQALNGQQSFQVKLPTNVTCTNCTLQIIEFMSSHGAPCFYHHCANISIQVDGADGGSGSRDGGDASSGGGSGGGGAAGTGGGTWDGGGGSSDAGVTTPTADGGCSCSFRRRGGPSVAGLGGLVALAFVVRRRRRV